MSAPIRTRMDYLKTNLKWEDFFSKESVELEEKMSGLDMVSLAKSKIRLSLENKILDWKKYETWVLENLGCASLKKIENESDLEKFMPASQEAYETYSNFDFWGEDLLPVTIWDSQLIVLGIHFNENLLKIENHIFVLAPPEVLNYFAKYLLQKVLSETNSSHEQASDNNSDHADGKIEGLMEVTNVSSINFKDLKGSVKIKDPLKVNKKAEPRNPVSIVQNEGNIWAFINDRHNEYTSEVRKQFDAYIVLKVEYDMTRVFKMDPDLEKENINGQLFSYSLKEENPFKRVFKSGVYESFGLSQLGLSIKNFKYACISALKCNGRVVGFLVGFKEKNLSEIDQILLEELAKETAAA